MEEKNKELDLIKIIQLLWSKRVKIIKWGVIGFVVGVIIALSIPREYTSSSMFAPEGSSRNAMGGGNSIAAMMGLSLGGNTTDSEGVRVMLYPEVIKSTPFVMEFADMEVTFTEDDVAQKAPLHTYLLEKQKHPWWSHVFALPGAAISGVIGLFTEPQEEASFEESLKKQQDFIKSFTSSVSVELDDKIGSISIRTTFQDPYIAKMVNDTLTYKLQRYMEDYRTARTRATLKSSTQMMEEARDKFYSLDDDYARAVDRNQNLISRSAAVSIDRLRDERNLAYQVYTQVALQVESERVKLQEQRMVATIIQPPLIPILPSAPGRAMIVIAYTFLAGAAAVGSILFKNRETIGL